MAFLNVNYHSASLQKACSMQVILPDGTKEPYAVMYLLHGLSDDHTIWTRRTSIERYVSGLPLAVVMPDGGRSFYCDAVNGPAHEAHIINDVISFVDTHFNTKAERSGRVISGLSMGGYGALKLALKFPDMFCSTASHSGGVSAGHNPFRDELASEMRLIYGEYPTGGKDDLWAIVEKIDKGKLPAIHIDCGFDDFLLEDNREFHQHLNKLNIPHEYEEFPGDHNWAYWDIHIQEAIRFHAKVLGI
jgi:S-formylglutathione hydrolase FrmB